MEGSGGSNYLTTQIASFSMPQSLGVSQKSFLVEMTLLEQKGMTICHLGGGIRSWC